MNKIDLTDRQFGKLKVIKESSESGKWNCVCECGNETTKVGVYLRNGRTRTCGKCPRKGPQTLDITGQKYGTLTAIKNTWAKNNNGCFIWEFMCDCGKTEEREIGNLRHKGNASKCKQCVSEAVSDRFSTHKTPKGDKTYKSWCKIKERCFNPNDREYHKYGARGISMHHDWVNNFVPFRDYVGEPPKDGKRYTIDRIDNTKGYAPGNIRWADNFQQARNKGMAVNNKTGFTGVVLDNKGTKESPKLYYKAQWKDLNSKGITKCFSVESHGDELAFFMACTYREHQIDLLNLQGAGYSKDHGKAGYNAKGGSAQ